MGDLIVFAVIGLLAGAAARTCCASRETQKVLGTMLLGLVGSVCGGLLTWALWPSVDGYLSFAALLTSFLGGVLVLVVGAIVSFARHSRAVRNFIP
jgi:uncharacterized membrane protein YeaQ/YmgE (transglycosylase-associated protein family)